MPTGPTQAEWERMPPGQREQIEEALLIEVEQAEAATWASLTPQEQLDLSEGETHLDAKVEARDTLRTFFGRIGRSIYVAAELPVLYPGQRAIRPDLVAVRDTGQHRRDAWVVVKEGKGIDLALEILNKGDRRKDLVDNPVDYALLGIQEYFVFDVRRGRLHGYRLPGPGARRYSPVLGNQGRYRSEVLELELAVEDGQLRFYMGSAELSTKDEELAKLGRLLEQEQARAEQEQARAEQEQARAEQEQARAADACRRLAEGILLLARLRELPLSEEQADRVRATSDVDLLSRWMERAATITAEELRQELLFLDS